MLPLLAPVMAMILPSSWTVFTGPDSGTAFILAADVIFRSCRYEDVAKIREGLLHVDE